jgi:hypothetical protein
VATRLQFNTEFFALLQVVAKDTAGLSRPLQN